MEQVFNRSFERVYAACKQALHDLDMSIEYRSKQEGRISASTGGSLFSWGETIDISIRNLGNRTKVIVESNSKAQLITWGKNDENENDILNRIEEILG